MMKKYGIITLVMFLLAIVNWVITFSSFVDGAVFLVISLTVSSLFICFLSVFITKIIFCKMGKNVSAKKVFAITDVICIISFLAFCIISVLYNNIASSWDTFAWAILGLFCTVFTVPILIIFLLVDIGFIAKERKHKKLVNMEENVK